MDRYYHYHHRETLLTLKEVKGALAYYNWMSFHLQTKQQCSEVQNVYGL